MCELCSRKTIRDAKKPVRMGTLSDTYSKEIISPKGHTLRLFEGTHIGVKNGVVVYLDENTNGPVNYLAAYEYDEAENKRQRLVAAQIFYCPICGEKL